MHRRWHKIFAGLTGSLATGWSGRHAPALNPEVDGIYVSRTSLDAAFDDNGWQVSPLMARLTGRVKGLETLFNRCGWQMASEGPSGLYMLTAEKS